MGILKPLPGRLASLPATRSRGTSKPKEARAEGEEVYISAAPRSCEHSRGPARSHQVSAARLAPPPLHPGPAPPAGGFPVDQGREDDKPPD